VAKWTPKGVTSDGVSNKWTNRELETQESSVTIGSFGATQLVTQQINDYNVKAHLLDNEYMRFGRDADFQLGYSSLATNLHLKLPQEVGGQFEFTRDGAFVLPSKDLSSAAANEGGMYYYNNNLYLGIGA
jgi:hypothetical protein